MARERSVATSEQQVDQGVGGHNSVLIGSADGGGSLASAYFFLIAKNFLMSNYNLEENVNITRL